MQKAYFWPISLEGCLLTRHLTIFVTEETRRSLSTEVDEKQNASKRASHFSLFLRSSCTLFYVCIKDRGSQMLSWFWRVSSFWNVKVVKRPSHPLFILTKHAAFSDQAFSGEICGFKKNKHFQLKLFWKVVLCNVMNDITTNHSKKWDLMTI